MKKVIILARVSSAAQSYKQQVEDLKEMAKADGYKENDILIINNKESAIKNDEEHLLGLNEMKDAIDANPIKSVYVREISRIGRREEVNLSIKKYLADKGIQLVVKTPSIRLLGADGKIDRAAEFAFSIFNVISQQEMEVKKERFAQGKKEAIANGKVIGSKLLFGYTKDEDNRIVIDEAAADIVRYVFSTYANTNASTATIYRELAERGQVRKLYSNETGGVNFIRNIIINPAYCGGMSKTAKKVHYKYPILISQELWNAANEKLKTMKNVPKTKTKHIIYTKGLVRCHCGHIMIGNVDALLAFRCPVCHQVINLNVIEHVAWTEAKVFKVTQLRMAPEENRKKYQEEISDNEMKIKATEKQISNLQGAMDRAYKGYVLGNINETLYKDTVKTIDMEHNKLQSHVVKLTETNVRLSELIKRIDEVDEFAAYDNIDAMTDDIEKRKLIHEVIDTIQLSKHEKGILITIIAKESPERFVNRYLYQPSTRPKTFIAYYKTLYDKKTDSFRKDTELQVYKEITNEIVKRFVRRRY